ncbi:MAG: chloride channel protein [Gammaproteobacteria bacterium]|nr:chloride channel protein [Gammaproteobacteria bacterium]
MLDHLRQRLARAEALPLLSLLGILTGLLAGLVIILFRLAIEGVQGVLLPAGGSENFEALGAPWRFFLPLTGALLLGIVFQLLRRHFTEVGVTHVIERLTYHQGHLPWQNAVAQFIGAFIAIASGNSVGREGPAVHLGAVNGSLLGQWLKLPNNSVRILVACGVAAAIGASFNTPLAGVIFAMEVVMMEYTMVGFTPVILAAAGATVLTRLFYGSAPAFDVPALQLASLAELPFVLLSGIAIGLLGALFIHLLLLFTKSLNGWPIWLRMGSAGLIAGSCALAVPEVMGVGYDTVNSALLGEFALTALVAITLFKLFATTASLGLGLPGGLIGPTLVVGASAGGALGVVAGHFFPENASAPGLYAMLGMAAMMGSTLQAPLAAMMAMLELTANPNLLLPGMVAVIAATMTSSELCQRGPVFLELLRARGLDYRNDPLAQSLRRLSVYGVMNRNVITTTHLLSTTQVETLLASKPQWILIREDEESMPRSLMPAGDLARHLQEQQGEGWEPGDVDLLTIPARRLQVAAVPFQATLQEGWELLASTQSEALYVVRDTLTRRPTIFGILSRQDIESNYLYNGRN